MHPKARTNEAYDVRHERLQHARRTGEYVDYPGQSIVPLEYRDGHVMPNAKALAAAKIRRNQNMGRQEVEHGNERNN